VTTPTFVNMAAEIIDLTSSPEPDESPAKAAASALKSFQPRVEKQLRKQDAAKAARRRDSREAFPSQAGTGSSARGNLQDVRPSLKEGNSGRKDKATGSTDVTSIADRRKELQNQTRGQNSPSDGPRRSSSSGQQVNYEVPTSFRTTPGGPRTNGTNGLKGVKHRHVSGLVQASSARAPDAQQPSFGLRTNGKEEQQQQQFLHQPQPASLRKGPSSSFNAAQYSERPATDLRAIDTGKGPTFPTAESPHKLKRGLASPPRTSLAHRADAFENDINPRSPKRPRLQDAASPPSVDNTTPRRSSTTFHAPHPKSTPPAPVESPEFRRPSALAWDNDPDSPLRRTNLGPSPQRPPISGHGVGSPSPAPPATKATSSQRVASPAQPTKVQSPPSATRQPIFRPLPSLQTDAAKPGSTAPTVSKASSPQLSSAVQAVAKQKLPQAPIFKAASPRQPSMPAADTSPKSPTTAFSKDTALRRSPGATDRADVRPPLPATAKDSPTQPSTSLASHAQVNPLAHEVLGLLVDCPTAKAVLRAKPDISRGKLMSLRHILLEDPSTRNDIKAIHAKLQARPAPAPAPVPAPTPAPPSHAHFTGQDSVTPSQQAPLRTSDPIAMDGTLSTVLALVTPAEVKTIVAAPASSVAAKPHSRKGSALSSSPQAPARTMQESQAPSPAPPQVPSVPIETDATVLSSQPPAVLARSDGPELSVTATANDISREVPSAPADDKQHVQFDTRDATVPAARPRSRKGKTKRLSAAASLALQMNASTESTDEDDAAKAKQIYNSFLPVHKSKLETLDSLNTPRPVTSDSLSTPNALSSGNSSDDASKRPLQLRANAYGSSTGVTVAASPFSSNMQDQLYAKAILEAQALSRMAIKQNELPGQSVSPPPLQRPATSQAALPSGKPTRPPPNAVLPLARPTSTGDAMTSVHGTPYTPEQDALIVRLREDQNLPWEVIVRHLNGRSSGSIQVRYYTKLKNRTGPDLAVAQRQLIRASEIGVDTADESESGRPKRRKRNNESSALDGFISWADVKKQRLVMMSQEEEAASAGSPQLVTQDKIVPQYAGERAYPKSVSRIMRQRELGSNSGRGWAPSSRAIADELKNHVFDDVGPRKFFKGTSSDVTCLAWAADGRHFAAGSIAITDEQSMQYNKPNNLLLGDHQLSLLAELADHHLPRPRIEDTGNANGLSSMRQTQDPRLFMTVASVQFSPDGQTLYSAGSDCKVRAYGFDEGVDRASCKYELEHSASLDLLSLSNHGIVATASHQSKDGCIGVYDGQMRSLSLSPSRQDTQVERAIFPSALRWGTAARHSNLLLAGFSIDSIDEERDMAGETCLWDLATESRIEVHAVTRNVFDVAWNPLASSASQSFAVASTPGGLSKVSRRTRSVVQCFAPRQNRAYRVLELECPAFDINDVVYCPYDDNLIAVGATDGKVYLWDQRYADAGHQPLHVLSHDASISVLDQDRDLEVADTGIRFLSWGATSSRLYSGSSDGVVKIWNPYMSSANAYVKDVATFTSAVMSGAFSPDYRELLIGEDQGQINLLSIGYGEKTVRSMERFDFHPAPARRTESSRPEGHAAADELLNTGQVVKKRMGALPVSQIVQGPNYKGPYLAPFEAELDDAESALQIARDTQHDAHARAAMDPREDSDSERATRGADKKVNEAHERMVNLQRRTADAAALEPKAVETQLAFRDARKARKIMVDSLPERVKHKRCKHDCNYLPIYTDEDGMPDSERSRDRIPTALWRADNLDIANATPGDLVEAGLTSKCMTCRGPASKPKKGKLAKCQDCTRKANGYTASCDICASPIRPPTEQSVLSKLCERCSFACFRCGKPTIIARDASCITCDSCDRTWKVGALGYELVRKAGGTGDAGELALNVGVVGEDEKHHFGLHAIEHYASKWQ